MRLLRKIATIGIGLNILAVAADFAHGSSATQAMADLAVLNTMLAAHGKPVQAGSGDAARPDEALRGIMAALDP